MKERIKTHGQDVPHNVYCNATAVLKIDSYKGGKNYYPQVYVEDCKYTVAENQQFIMLVMMVIMMMDFLRCKKKVKIIFVTCFGLQN